ncbi:MAG: hypothetical protein HY593_00440 [Candidatus Omnitrophica bacterium]|nr:hypothetical protein [Candidatus Omnitrophota bacterium]
MSFVKWSYDILFLIGFLAYLPFFLKKGKHKDGFLSRLGMLPKESREYPGTIVWLHGVSVGETTQALKLAERLREKLGDGVRFVFTATTAAGKEVAEKRLHPQDRALYFPLDFGPSVRLFLKTVKPKAVVIVETELWPNLIWELSENRIPLFIVNGRISDRAIWRYCRFRFFFRPLLRRITGIYAQDEEAKRRFIDLGAREEAVQVTGNMKFDWKPSLTEEAWLRSFQGELKSRDHLLWIAGSTHEGEEKALLDVYQSLKRRHPRLRLLLAPRHLRRVQEVKAIAEKKGLAVQEIMQEEMEKESLRGEVFVLNVMGVLALLYQAADLVFVGGSLVPKGGHNLAEPAFFEKPIVFGPFMENFQEMAETFKNAKGARQVSNAEELEKELEALLGDETERRRLGRAAKDLMAGHRGAAQRNAERILAVLRSQTGGYEK